jgi:uncharacterized protein YecT (DUF1311 family)
MRIIVLLLACILSSTIHAKDAVEDECSDDNRYCKAQRAHASAAQADKALNNEYKALLLVIAKTDISDEFKKSLVISQKAWITFRDTACNFVSLIEDPSSGKYGGQSVRCLASLTYERTSQIHEYRKCLESTGEETTNECQYTP